MTTELYETIKSNLELIFEYGQTFEVRAINGKKICAGFFRDCETAAREIVKLDVSGAWVGIYVTINEVDPELYNNRPDVMSPAYGVKLTGDADIINRRWLVIDVDPERKASTSATESEKKLAMDIGGAVRNHLRGMGFPEPIIADSGNGMHVLYRIDEPAKTDLIRKVLVNLAKKFNSTSDGIKCKIDTSVSNAARIIKLYGTMSRKGENTEENPHRRSYVLFAPDNIEIVPHELLVLASGEMETTHEDIERLFTKKEDFKPLIEYLNEWGVTWYKKFRKADDLGYKLDICPFSSEDHRGDAYVSQNIYTGELTAKCFHESCGGQNGPNRWKEFRAIYDPFYYNGPNLFEVKEEDIPEVKYHKLDVKLSRNNFIVKYIDYWKTRTDAYNEYHYAAALSLLSIAADRVLVYRLASANIYTNIWMMCLGKSSISRKSTAVNATNLILESGDWLKPFHRFPGMFSTEGLIEEMSEEPRGYMIIDECTQLLVSINQKKYLSDMRDVLCKLYDCVGTRRKLKTSRGKVSEFKVENPYATFLYATTHESFIGGCSDADLTSGWLIRFLYCYPQYQKDTMGVRDATGDEEIHLGDIASDFWNIAGQIKEYEEIRCSLTPFGFNYFNEWMSKTEADLLQSGIHGSVFQRYAMYALKMAALYYIGEPGVCESWDKADKKIRIIIPDSFLVESVRQINDYFLPVSRGVICDVSDAASDNIQNKIIMFLRGEPNRTAKKSKLLRYIRKPAKEVNTALETMEEAEMIVMFQGKEEGVKKQPVYIRYVMD